MPRSAESIRKAQQTLAALREQVFVVAQRTIDAPRAVYVVRAPGGYTWEIRRYGGLILERGSDVYGCQEAARNAGKAQL